MIDYADCRGRAAMCRDLAEHALSETNERTWKMLADCWLLVNRIEDLVEQVLVTNEESRPHATLGLGKEMNDLL